MGEKDSAQTHTIGKRSCSVVIVEDEAIVRMVFESEIRDLGHNPFSFSNTKDCIEFLNSKDSDGKENHKHVALIISDLNMPGGGGHEVLNERNRLNPHIPFYILSGNAKPKDSDKSLAGITGYMEKPVFSEDIVKLLKKVLH